VGTKAAMEPVSVKVALMSDIHGNSAALAVALESLSDDVETILFLGDLVGYYPFVEECSSLLASRYLTGVRGNHDQVLLQCIEGGVGAGAEYQRRYGSALDRTHERLSPETGRLIQSWPLFRHEVLAGQSVFMVHGTPWDPLEGRVYPDFEDWARFDDCAASVVLMGHTHYAFEKRWKGKLLVNPGSIGQSRDRSGMACFATLDLSSGQVIQHAVRYNPDRILTDAQRHDPDLHYLVDVLTR
jgi:predicted phosphodiesterase